MTFARGLVALGLLFAWGSLGQISRVEGVPFAPDGLSSLGWLVGAAGRGVGTALFVAGLFVWVTRRGPAWLTERVSPPLLVLLLALGATLQGWQWPPGVSPNGATTLPGAALLAFWLGDLAQARRARSSPGNQAAVSWGFEAACGVVAVSYPLAGLSKLLTSGWAWADAGNIGLHIASHSYAGLSLLQPLRLAVAESGPLCAAMGVGTLIIELGTLLFLAPALRMPITIAVVSLHLGIALLMGLHHYDWMFTTVGWALWSRRPGAGAP